MTRASFHCGANGAFADRFVMEHCPQPGLAPGTAKFWRRGLQPGRPMQAALVVGEVEVSQFSDEMIGNCPPLLSEQKKRRKSKPATELKRPPTHTGNRRRRSEPRAKMARSPHSAPPSGRLT